MTSTSRSPSTLAIRAAAALLLLSACGGTAVETATPPAPSPGAPATPPETEDPVGPTKPFDIAWGTCSIPVGRGAPIQAECATVDAPARRGVAGSGTTPVAVYRLKSKKQPASAQMWFLNGGPGGAGFSLAPLAEMVTTFERGVDAYLIDHRGTGESTFLDCPAAISSAQDLEEYARACSTEIRKAYGDRVDGFSTTESAHDVRELIDSTAAKDQKVFVYGGSYGSYWAHRLLQLPGVRVDAVVTDGNCLGPTCTFDTPQAFGVDEAMKFIFDDCKEETECKARLGDEPFAFVAATLKKLEAGHCNATKLSARSPIDLAFSVGLYWPTGLAPIFHRLDRCGADDVKALDVLESKLQEFESSWMQKALPILGPVPKPSEAASYSSTLLMHVVASEMVSKPAPSAATLEAKAASLTFKPSPQDYQLGYLDSWAGYPRDAHVGGWVERDVPWLMMQGTYDFQTVLSLSTEAMKHVKNPSLQFVRVDAGGHGVVFDSSCALGMLEKFLASPKDKVDTACLADVKTKGRVIDPAYTQYFLGTSNAWD